MIALALAAVALAVGRPGPALEWSSPDHYRLVVTVDSGLRRRSNAPAALDVDFPAELRARGAAGTFEEATVEVVAYDDAGQARAFDRKREGRERFLLPRVIGFRDGTGAVVILQDVTRFRLLDDVKTNLVATVSHELKTPLTSIRMAVHLLLEERIGALNAKQTELLLASREDAERLLDLINNLLNLARLESGASAAERVVCQPDQLIRNAVAQASELVTGGVTQIVAEADPNLPPVVISPDQIAHVFANLISNAIKHSPPGEQVVVSARRQGEDAGIRFSVIDHGDGVPVAERERIFEKFYRVPGEQREGAGLGLAIAREIIKAHHGRIGVVDAPGGRGSEFFFVLPMQLSATPAELIPDLVTS